MEESGTYPEPRLRLSHLGTTPSIKPIDQCVIFLVLSKGRDRVSPWRRDLVVPNVRPVRSATCRKQAKSEVGKNPILVAAAERRLGRQAGAPRPCRRAAPRDAIWCILATCLCDTHPHACTIRAYYMVEILSHPRLVH